ncbi:hypothetical protein HMI55_004627 [Coelomomyces lativittatus]|nr:hypothetical protein HMI55_004627 [Coelomomyces lativittatus]
MRESWMESDLSLRFHKKYEPSSIRPSRALRSTEIDSTRFWNLSWLTNATDIACFHCKKSITLDNIENKFTSPINKKL